MSVLIDDGEHVADELGDAVADAVAGPIGVTDAAVLGAAAVPAGDAEADALVPVELDVGAQAAAIKPAEPAANRAVASRRVGVRTVIGSPGFGGGQLGSG